MPHSPSPPEGGWPRPAFEVADIFRAHGEAYRLGHTLTPEQAQAVRAIVACRTAALGGHLEACDRCDFERPAYNSCRNRHCPKCQGASQAAWVERHMGRVLETHYFHVVFTLPAELRPLVHRNRRLFFDLLFDAAAQTLLALGQDRLGATLGFTAVLHTWTRDLSFHPHVHCVVTGGGLANDQSKWTAADEGYLFPHLVISRLFRGKFMAGLVRAYNQGRLDLGGQCAPLDDPELFGRFKDRLYRKEWVVYQKPPFGGPEDVYRYLGRYTHRIAISNHRLEAIDEKNVRFRTNHGKTATLGHQEFIRRFLLHILSKGFVKIRHYGLMSPCLKTKLELARRLLESNPLMADPTTIAPEKAWPKQEEDATTTVIDPARCPRCGEGVLVRRPLPDERRPPPVSLPP